RRFGRHLRKGDVPREKSVVAQGRRTAPGSAGGRPGAGTAGTGQRHRHRTAGPRRYGDGDRRSRRNVRDPYRRVSGCGQPELRDAAASDGGALMAEHRLVTPLATEQLAPLKAGDRVYLSGIVYTARDAAHQRM